MCSKRAKEFETVLIPCVFYQFPLSESISRSIFNRFWRPRAFWKAESMCNHVSKWYLVIMTCSEITVEMPEHIISRMLGIWIWSHWPTNPTHHAKWLFKAMDSIENNFKSFLNVVLRYISYVLSFFLLCVVINCNCT